MRRFIGLFFTAMATNVEARLVFRERNHGRLVAGGDCSPERCTDDELGHCLPFTSPEHCEAYHSLPLLLQNRYPYIVEPQESLKDDWFFPLLDDPVGAYQFTVQEGMNPPKIRCCVTRIEDLLDPKMCDLNAPIVIRSFGGIVNDELAFPRGLDQGDSRAISLELRRGKNINMPQVLTHLARLSPNTIIVQDFVAGAAETESPRLPNQYQFHVFDGQIGAISAIMHDRGCYGEYTEDWECLHKKGCFVPAAPFGKNEMEDEVCYSIDYGIGALSPRPVHGHGLCGSVPSPYKCVFDEMKRIAKRLSSRIGVYVRIDMVVASDNTIFVEGYNFNHLDASRHCTSKVSSSSGCDDSCFMGRMWQDSAQPSGHAAIKYGGPKTAFPDYFRDFPPNNDDKCSFINVINQRVARASAACVDTLEPSSMASAVPSVSPDTTALSALESSVPTMSPPTSSSIPTGIFPSQSLSIATGSPVAASAMPSVAPTTNSTTVVDDRHSLREDYQPSFSDVTTRDSPQKAYKSAGTSQHPLREDYTANFSFVIRDYPQKVYKGKSSGPQHSLRGDN